MLDEIFSKNYGFFCTTRVQKCPSCKIGKLFLRERPFCELTEKSQPKIEKG